jgi:hypothetical protein
MTNQASILTKKFPARSKQLALRCLLSVLPQFPGDNTELQQILRAQSTLYHQITRNVYGERELKKNGLYKDPSTFVDNVPQVYFQNPEGCMDWFIDQVEAYVNRPTNRIALLVDKLYENRYSYTDMYHLSDKLKKVLQEDYYQWQTIADVKRMYEQVVLDDTVDCCELGKALVQAKSVFEQGPDDHYTQEKANNEQLYFQNNVWSRKRNNRFSKIKQFGNFIQRSNNDCPVELFEYVYKACVEYQQLFRTDVKEWLKDAKEIYEYLSNNDAERWTIFSMEETFSQDVISQIESTIKNNYNWSPMIVPESIDSDNDEYLEAFQIPDLEFNTTDTWVSCQKITLMQ